MCVWFFADRRGEKQQLRSNEQYRIDENKLFKKHCFPSPDKSVALVMQSYALVQKWNAQKSFKI